MIRIRFTGWDVGARGIPFTKLLKSEAGLKLTDAMEIKNAILDGQFPILEVPTTAQAESILAKSEVFGFRCVIVE